MRTSRPLLKRATMGLAVPALLLSVTPSRAFAQREAVSYTMVCVPYSATTGACWESTYYSDGSIDHNRYYYWGNWWV